MATKEAEISVKRPKGRPRKEAVGMDPAMVETGLRLRKARHVARLTMLAVARKSEGKITATELSSMECGRQPVSLKKLLPLCLLYGRTVEYFLPKSVRDGIARAVAQRKG